MSRFSNYYTLEDLIDMTRAANNKNDHTYSQYDDYYADYDNDPISKWSKQMKNYDMPSSKPDNKQHKTNKKNKHKKQSEYITNDVFHKEVYDNRKVKVEIDLKELEELTPDVEEAQVQEKEIYTEESPIVRIDEDDDELVELEPILNESTVEVEEVISEPIPMIEDELVGLEPIFNESTVNVEEVISEPVVEEPPVKVEAPTEYKRKNYTVLKVRRIPKPLPSKKIEKNKCDNKCDEKECQKVYIKTDIDLIDLDPVQIINEGDMNMIYVDEDLELLVTENRITEEVRDKLISLYLDGEKELMIELKNLIFSIHYDVNTNNRMDVTRWDNLICSDVTVDVLSHIEFEQALIAHSISQPLDLPENDLYLMYHISYQGRNEEDKCEFFRCISCGPTRDLTKVCNIFRV